MIKKLLAALSIAILSGSMIGCESTTEPTNTNTSGIVTANDRAVFVVNEGQFGKANSTLDVIVLRNALSADASAKRDTVYYRNVLSQMGEANDILISGNSAIVLDNAASSLYIVRVDSLIKTSTISLGLDQPNKMAFVAKDQLIVTRRGRTSAAIVDLTSKAVVDSVVIGEPSIAVAVLNNKAYVTSGSPGAMAHVNVVDLTSRKVTKSRPVITGAESIIADSANTQFIVTSTGDYATLPSVLYVFNGVSGELKDSVNGPIALAPTLIGGAKFFAVTGGMVSVLDTKTLLAGTLIINATGTSFYQGYYDQTKDELYLGLSDFTGNPGRVNVYNASTGALKWSFMTGIAPAHFAFYH